MTLSAGTRLGPYEILAPLGAGGMGEVYRARDTRLGREVAVKVLSAEFSADPQRRARFEQEARAASALNHPNIVSIHDIGAHDAHLFIAMEHIDGRTLRDILESGRMPASRALDIGVQIAEGLARAHAAGIVHRDLKPENVMISKDGFVKILDFGLAKLAAVENTDQSNLPTFAPQKTDAGTVMGTVGYMSPEQAAGRSVDFRSDQFSLGTILYEMGTGKRPFLRPTAAQTMTAIIQEDPEPIASINPKLPPPLRWIVDRCLAKEPDARYASTTDLARELKSLRDHLSEATSASVSAGVPAAKTRRLPMAGIAAALLAVALAALLSNRLTLKARPAVTAPVFHRLTFGRGTIWGARFAPDGGTIVYSAAWNGDKPRLFTVREDNLFSTQLTLPPAILFGMSSQSELALGREPRFETTLLLSGTLARSPLSGGAPRDIEENVAFADWAPNGQSIAVARDIGGRFALFYPEDHLLYQSSGWISHPRFSPDGSQLAFLDHPPNGDSGDVVVVSSDGRGKPRTIASQFVSVQGLAWRPDGAEVWVTGTRTGISRALEGISLAGKERTICRVPATFTLYDLLKDGRALIAEEDYRESLFAGGASEAPARDLSALDWAGPGGLSPDGTLVSFDETGEGGGDNGVIYLRRMDGSPPVRLGAGSAGGFSPDGQWVTTTAFDGRSVTVYPTGAGKPRTFPVPLLAGRTQFVSRGREVEFRGVEKGHAPRLYALSLDSGKLRPISDEGLRSTTYTPTSPDGQSILALGKEARPMIYPTAGGTAKSLPGSELDDFPAGWSADGMSVYVYRRGENPVRVFRIDLASGKRTLWKQISPPDPAGITGIAPVIVSPRGDAYIYGATRILSTLYLVEGLK
jgi:hypothetical protein